MKKIIFLVAFLLAVCFVSAQHPVGVDSFALQTLGNTNVLIKSKAAIGSDSGFVNAHFADTAAANRSKISHYPGAQIAVGDLIFIRNITATKWISIGASITAQFYDSTSLNYNSTKYIYYSGVTPVDSVSITAATNLATTNLLQTANRAYDANNLNLSFRNIKSLFQQVNGGGSLNIDAAEMDLLHSAKMKLASPLVGLPLLPNNNALTRILVSDGTINGWLYWRDASTISGTETDPLSVHTSDSAAMLNPYLSKVLAAATYATIANLNLKQNLITLTTTGSSGAATFNQSTGALNIPSYAGGGGAAMKAQAPLIVSNDTISRRWNVRDYGATGDSLQDATTYIQATINACITAGGGTVFFPNGFYWLSSALVTSENGSNPNSQLYLPPVIFETGGSSKTHITFLGETKPYFTPAGLNGDTKYPRSGVVIKSTITGSGSIPAVFGGNQGGGFTYIYASFENLAILVPANAGSTGPTMTGINGKDFASINVNNCVVGIDISLYRDTLPSNEVAGIITTRSTGETVSGIRNTFVYGYRYGIVAGEHGYLENVQAANCYASFVIQGATFPSHPVYATKIESMWSKYDILIPATSIFGLITGFASFDIGMIAVETYGYRARWFNNVATINDSSNNAIGKIYYKVLTTGASGNGSFLKYNGTGINAYAYNVPGSTPMAIGDAITSATSGSVLFAGTGSQLQQINSQLFYDSTNKRLGIGTTSPSQPLTVSKNQNAATDVLISNTTGGTAAQARLVVTGNVRSGYFGVTSNSFTPTGSLAANDVFIHADTGPLNLMSGSSGSPGAVKFSTDISGTLTEAGRFSAGGNFLLGTTTDDAANKLQVTGSLKVTNSSGAYPISVSTSASIAAYFQGTTAGNQTAFYLENDRGGFNSYGGFLYGGSTQASSLFGVTRADKLMMFADGANNLGMYVGTLSNQPFVMGTNNVARITVSNAGAVRFHTYGAGTATFDASGNITSVSDERLKNIQGFYKSGLKELMNINPIIYKWNKKSGLEMQSTYAGFSAQNVKANIPLSTGIDSKGYLTLQDRAIVATLVNAVKEQQQQIEDLKTEIKLLKAKR